MQIAVLYVIQYLLCFQSSANQFDNQVFYIEPAIGQCCSAREYLCFNITDFGLLSNNFVNSTGITVYFLEGTHFLQLSDRIIFAGLHNAVFAGLGRMEQGPHETVWQSTSVIKCTDQAGGIVFGESSNITFKFLTTNNCGIGENENFSLGFLDVQNIVVYSISIQNGTGYGLLIISDTSNVTISSSSFSSNNGDIFIEYIEPENCPTEFNVYTTQSVIPM